MKEKIAIEEKKCYFRKKEIALPLCKIWSFKNKKLKTNQCLIL